MKRLFSFLRPYKGQLWYSIGSSVTNKVLDLMPPILVGWVIDSVRGEAPAWMKSMTGLEEPMNLAIFLAVLAVVIFGVESLFEWMYKKGFMRLAQRVQHDLRIQTYRRMQNQEMAFFEKQRTGEAIAILNDDINQLERFLNTGFNEIVQLLVIFAFAGFVLFNVSWELALIGLVPIPLIIWGSFYYQKIIAPRYSRMREEVGKLSSRLENNLSGIAVIKSFTAEDYEAERLRENSDAYKKANFGVIRFSAMYIPLIRMFIAIGFGGVLLVGSYWVLTDAGIITVGELVLFSMMIQRILWPMTRLGETLDNYERAKASTARVFRIFDREPPVQNVPAPSGNGRSKGKVVFSNVSFSYVKELPVLDGLDFAVKAGETVGVAGTTGSGKSTLVKLLLRFYDVESGAVKLDGVDVKEYDIEWLRKQIALVSQDVYLFHGTIAENIAYGSSGVSDAEIEEASRLAELHSFVAGLPAAYATLVGERGIRLSGGQRQRLSIARAILKNAPVLVLDEATSSVDTETERAIQDNLDRFAAGRTAIVVAHRLSTIRNADRIIVLDKGKVAETGTHEELIEKGGKYAELWKIQTGIR